MSLTRDAIKEAIIKGETTLGIELGSTRIKAVLVDANHVPIASGSHEWENQLVDGIWTYSEEAIWTGLQDSYQKMAQEVQLKYEVDLETIGSIGFSAMMHGYMPFNREGEMLVPFRTWRNTITEAAATKLTELFEYHIPQRWSIAHLYQAILNEEEHVKDIEFITTLAGYIHWQLTGEKVVGIGEASGMFPIDTNIKDYHRGMLQQFDALIKGRNGSLNPNSKEDSQKTVTWKLKEILPRVLLAGECAGTLTEEGVKKLDVTGKLKAGIKVCPPEGDAGTGMVATNSIAKRTGNVSAGTSVFAMIVLEKELSKVYDAIDLVTTPTGDLVAMVHCNNCTSDLNAWVHLFKEFAETFGMEVDMNELFAALYRKALEGDDDCGGLLAYNYFSGEHITGFEEGRPLFVRHANSKFNLANFMRTHLFTALSSLKVGLDLLMQEEQVQVDEIFGHGGLFKTKEVGQKILAAAINAPVSVMETAGEGGAWGIAVLAAYMKAKEDGNIESLESYLMNKVFVGQKGSKIEPEQKDVDGFNAFIKRYTEGLGIERAAVESLK